MALHVDPRFYQAGPFDNGSIDKLTVSPEAFKTIFIRDLKEPTLPKNNNYDWVDFSQWYEAPPAVHIPAGVPYVTRSEHGYYYERENKLGRTIYNGETVLTERRIPHPLPSDTPGVVITILRLTGSGPLSRRALAVGDGLWRDECDALLPTALIEEWEAVE